MDAPISPKGISKDAQRCVWMACKLAAPRAVGRANPDTSPVPGSTS